MDITKPFKQLHFDFCSNTYTLPKTRQHSERIAANDTTLGFQEKIVLKLMNNFSQKVGLYISFIWQAGVLAI